MTAIVDALHEDHRNSTQLLDVLERQCNMLADGDDPDYDLLEEIVEYLLAYPDIYHHPKEDAVYEQLQRRAPEVAQALGTLSEQHDELQRLTRGLGDTVRGLRGEFFAPRDQVVQSIREFIDVYRRHIHWEETAFFPLAEQLLSADDWEHLDRNLESASDPLFGGQAKDQYLAIRNDILRAARGE